MKTEQSKSNDIKKTKDNDESTAGKSSINQNPNNLKNEVKINDTQSINGSLKNNRNKYLHLQGFNEGQDDDDDLESIQTNLQLDQKKFQQLHTEYMKLKMKDFLNFTEKRNIEWDGRNFNVSLTQLSNRIVSQINISNIENLINSLELKPFELMIVIDNCLGGYASLSVHSKDWNMKQLNWTATAQRTENESVLSEVDMQNFFEKCIIPQSDVNKILFVGYMLSNNSLCSNFDDSIEKIKKQQAYRELNIEVLCIVKENQLFVNSIFDKESFEQALRYGSKVWTKPRSDDPMFQHDIDDKFNVIDPSKSHKFHLLEHATHQIILDPCTKGYEYPNKEYDETEKKWIPCKDGKKKNNVLNSEQSFNTFNSIYSMILQNIMITRGKPMIMIGALQVDPKSILDCISRGIPYLLLNTRRFEEISFNEILKEDTNNNENQKPLKSNKSKNLTNKQIIDQAFNNVIEFAKSVKKRENKGEPDENRINYSYLWTSIFAYIRKTISTLKRGDNQLDRNIKLWYRIDNQYASDKAKSKKDEVKINLNKKVYTEIDLIEDDIQHEDEYSDQELELKLAQCLWYICKLDIPHNSDRSINIIFDEDNYENIQKEGTLKFIKSIFQSKQLQCSNIQDIDDLNTNIKIMINNNKLPDVNNYEELMIIRSALDQKDLQSQLSEYYKNVSKSFMFVLMIKQIFLAIQSVFSEKYPNQFIKQASDELILICSTIVTTFIAGLFTQTSPISKWLILKASERQIDSEIWKFRTRVGDQSLEKQLSTTIVKHLREFLSNVTTSTMNKANLSETDIWSKHQSSIIKHNQHRLSSEHTNCEDHKFIKCEKLITNNEDELQPLDILLQKENPQKPVENIIDNHYSPLTPELQIRFRMIKTIQFQQDRLPSRQSTIVFYSICILLFGSFGTILAYFKQFGWISVVTVLLSQINQQKEFNGQEKKAARQNATIKALTDMSLWWMSLNRTEKNSRGYVEKLVLDVEGTISEEYKKWMATSQASKVTKSATDSKEDEQNKSKHENKQGKKLV